MLGAGLPSKRDCSCNLVLRADSRRSNGAHFDSLLKKPSSWLFDSSQILRAKYARSGSRTHTELLPGDFKSPVSTIPPSKQRKLDSLIRIQERFKSRKNPREKYLPGTSILLFVVVFRILSCRMLENRLVMYWRLVR